MTDNAEQLDEIYADIDNAIEESGIEEAAPENEEENSQEQENSQNLDSEKSQQESEAESEVETEARKKGWRPKEEFEGDASEWVDAGEFNRRGELLDAISHERKNSKALKKQLDAVTEYVKGLEGRTRQKVLDELEAKRREALTDGDIETFDAVEEKIKEVNEAPELEIEESEPAKPDNDGVPDFVSDFAKQNEWFHKDKEMTAVMLANTERLVTEDGLTLEQAIPKAHDRVKEIFPGKFTNPNKDKPSAVMSGNREQRPSKKALSNLTPEQKTVWHALKHVMTEKEFLDSLED